MNSWPERSIADIAAPGKNSLATGPFGSAISSRFFREQGVPVVRGSNLSLNIGQRLLENDFVFIDEMKASEFERSIATRGDLIFTCWGTIGQVGLVDQRSRFDRYIVSNKQMKLTPDPRVADSLYLYYVLSAPKVVSQVQASSIGSSVPGFNLSQLRQISITCPPLVEQHAIAATLGALDDKILVNEHIAAKAFDIAQAMHAGLQKSAGKSMLLGDLVELRYGKSLPAARRKPGTVPVIGSGGVGGYHSEALVEGPGVIIGRKGTIGSVHWSDGDFFPIDTTFYVSVKLPEISMEYMYLALQALRLHEMNSDSAVPGLNRDRALAVRVSVPSPEAVTTFTEKARWLLRLKREHEQENATLAALRDALLPQLISGELRVRDVERIVEDAV